MTGAPVPGQNRTELHDLMKCIDKENFGVRDKGVNCNVAMTIMEKIMEFF